MKKLLIAIGLLSLLGLNSAVPAPGADALPAVAEMSQQQQQLPITTKGLYLEDSRRQKTIPVRITFPEGDGPFPVIIFSHGLFGSRENYGYLAKYWAQHGYVCIQPSHDDSISWMRERNKHIRLVQFMKQQATDKSAWIARVGDISFIIDSLPLTQELEGKLDVHKIGVCGHSYGAFTATLIAGARVPQRELAPKIDSLADSRVKAIVAMSAQGIRAHAHGLGFDDKDCFTIGIPALIMTGDCDKLGATTPEMREEPFKYSPPGDKYCVSINGANHMTFAGSRIEFPFGESMKTGYGDQEAHQRIIEQASTLFLDAYVKGNASARSMLQRGGLTSLVGRAGRVQGK